MTVPNIRDTTGRPAVELAGATADSPLSTVGNGRCAVVGEFGSGTDAATVIAGEYGDIPPVPFGITFDHWDILAYDTAGGPLAISAVIDVLATDYASNSFGSIAGSDKPTLSGAVKNTSAALTGWTLSMPAYTMYRVTLVSFTGSPGKIVVAAQGLGA